MAMDMTLQHDMTSADVDTFSVQGCWGQQFVNISQHYSGPRVIRFPFL